LGAVLCYGYIAIAKCTEYNIYAFSRGISMNHELILSVEQAGINKTQAQVLINIGLFGT
jgi:hypothetical protein